MLQNLSSLFLKESVALADMTDSDEAKTYRHEVVGMYVKQCIHLRETMCSAYANAGIAVILYRPVGLRRHKANKPNYSIVDCG